MFVFSSEFAHLREGLDSGKDLEDIEVKTPLSVMKPMHAQWIIELYNELTSSSRREVVVNGWKATGIYDAIEMGSAKLPPLDPFLEIDEIVIPTNDFNSTPQFPEKDHPDLNS